MKNNSIQELEFQMNEDESNSIHYYSKEKNNLDFIKGDEFNFKAIEIINVNFELSTNSFLQESKFSPLDLSQYFYEYFEFNKPDNDKDFIYYETPERAELMKKLNGFYFSKFNYFKFCGPISGGKSTTLLKFKNEKEGVVYFNLKVIKKYYLTGNPIYKSIMLYELKRIKINDKKEGEVKEKIDKIMEKNEILETIFTELIEFFIWLSIRNILIIDQFKYTDFDSTTLDKIQKKIYNTSIGLIISSSIDEKEIKNELVITLNKFYKMPKVISLNNQNYFFYVPDLLKNNIVKEKFASQKEISKDFIDLYEQFAFKTEYISLLGGKDNIDKGFEIINNQIIKSIIKQSIFPESVALEFVLLLINDNIGINIEYNEENINIIRKIPLKFIDVNFDDTYFSCHYGFPYIRTLVENSKKTLDIKKYFEQKMYEKKFYSLFKGIYFEDAVNRSILEKKIYFDNKDNKIYKIIVNNIIEMKGNDVENNANTIINRIKNNAKDNSYVEKDYKNYINDRLLKIQKELSTDNKGEININLNLKEALEEESKIIQKEIKNLENIKDKKRLPKKYEKQIIPIYDEEFKKGNILIEQTQTNGRCLDAAFLYGDQDSKTLICLQMKFYEKATTVSSDDKKKLDKSYIKSVCRKVLSNIYLNLGIKVETWHYILILHYDHVAKSFNTNFVKICLDNDLEYMFFDPIVKKFYNKEQKEVKLLKLNYLTNLDIEEQESNPIKCFHETELVKLYLKKRNRELTQKTSPKIIAQQKAKEFEKKYNISFNEFFEKIKNNYEYIKKINITLSLTMEMDEYFPILNNGYGYIFLNDRKDDLVFEGKINEKFITLNYKNNDDIPPLKIYSTINIEEEFEYFVVKLN